MNCLDVFLTGAEDLTGSSLLVTGPSRRLTMKKAVLVLAALFPFTGFGSDSPGLASQPMPEREYAASSGADGLIPRHVLFGNEERVAPRLSPCGESIAYAASVDGVMNLWLMDSDGGNPNQLTFDENRGVRYFFWAHNGDHIIYIQDETGEENFHVFRLTPDTGEVMNLTPFPGVRAHIFSLNPRHPDTVLLEMNKNDPSFFDVYSCDLRTGELTMVGDNPGVTPDGDMVLEFMADLDLIVRLKLTIHPETGDYTIHHRWDSNSPWEPLNRHGADDEWSPESFTADGQAFFVRSNLNRDKTALYRFDIASGTEGLIAEDDLSDIVSVSYDPLAGEPRIASFNYLRKTLRVLDSSIEDDIRFLQYLREGDLSIVSRSADDETWIVSFSTIDNPLVYFVYHRDEMRARELFTAMPALEDYTLRPMTGIEIRSRDGLTLPSYITTPDPARYGEGPWPTILMPHGGPAWRDYYGYDPFTQLFADRGFAVLQVNYRGSTGFGKAFLNAGNKEWGGAMQDDLTDGVLWASEEGIADPDRVVILGFSYGGYAALAGAVFTPELYCAVVDVFGPSDLITFQERMPPYWIPWQAQMNNAIGNPNDPEDRAMLESRSPVHFVERISVPIFIAQGANDPRVVQAESDQMVEALRRIGTPVLYALYNNEGHGFANESNRLDFVGRVEQFLYSSVPGPGIECEMFIPPSEADVTLF
jgi:dipeptidyl aminopeptidase/acylaminoacyl peptidase